MIFAAGLGTRLQPLTHDRPKALVQVKGKTLLEWTMLRLIRAGSRQVIVNVHHFADQIEDFLKQKDYFGIEIAVSDEREKLLDTGGGLKKAAWFFDDGKPFLVCNTDILTSMDLGRFFQSHLVHAPLATLAIQRRASSRQLWFDANMRLRGWQNLKTGLVKPPGTDLSDLSPFAFSGLHVMSPAIFRYMPEADVFSIIDVYLEILSHEVIGGYRHDDDFWIDAGKPASLDRAEKLDINW